jgi:hypothetical protein
VIKDSPVHRALAGSPIATKDPTQTCVSQRPQRRFKRSVVKDARAAASLEFSEQSASSFLDRICHDARSGRSQSQFVSAAALLHHFCVATSCHCGVLPFGAQPVAGNLPRLGVGDADGTQVWDLQQRARCQWPPYSPIPTESTSISSIHCAFRCLSDVARTGSDSLILSSLF